MNAQIIYQGGRWYEVVFFTKDTSGTEQFFILSDLDGDAAQEVRTPSNIGKREVSVTTRIDMERTSTRIAYGTLSYMHDGRLRSYKHQLFDINVSDIDKFRQKLYTLSRCIKTIRSWRIVNESNNNRARH